MLEYNWGSSLNNIPLEWLSGNGNLYSVKALCIFCQNFKLNCWFCHSFPRCKCSMCKEMDNPLLCYVKLVFLWSFQNHKNCSKCVNLQVAIDFNGSSPARSCLAKLVVTLVVTYQVASIHRSQYWLHCSHNSHCWHVIIAEVPNWSTMQKIPNLFSLVMTVITKQGEQLTYISCC